MSKQYDLSIVIPCYQEEKHLKESVTAIFSLMNRTKYSFEMIFVDDCSKDKTREVISEIIKTFPDTRSLFHEINTGRGGAFMDGVRMAQGKYVGFLDIDLEVSCVYLLNILLELDKGYDVVTVRRHYAISPTPIFILRHMLSVGYKLLIHWYLGMPKMDTESGYKFFQAGCIQTLSADIKNKGWFFDTEVMVLAYHRKYKMKEVDGLFRRRGDKMSTVKLFRDTIDYFREVRRFKQRMGEMSLISRA